jgi:acyl-CoA dehydrogenase
MSDVSDLVRDVVAGGGDLWSTLAELGLTTIGVPEAAGGSGGDLPDLVEVVAALGERGAAVPIAEHATAAWALGFPPELGTVALAGPGRVLVPWASRATHVVLAPPGGTTLVATLHGMRRIPGTDTAGQSLDEVDVDRVETVAGVVGDDVGARLAVLRAATLVGAVRGAFRLTRDHVRTREQFGGPLVRLPAVATALARLKVELLQAETALDAALDAHATPRAATAAAVARVVCGGVATEAARIAHQLHGALGITQEYDLHPVTRLLWATRDADLPEEHWAATLGAAALAGGEESVWSELTAAAHT